jgi:hypothetical protein
VQKLKTSWFVYLAAILLVVLVGYAIWSTQVQKPAAPETEEIEEVVEVEEEATPAAEEITPVEVEEATPAAEEDEEVLIKAAVLESVGLEEEEVEFMISTNTGTHAKGNIREIDAVSGAYWLAAKFEGEWIAVYDGQANPPCEDVDLYDFPSDMVPECIDEDGELVIR